MPRTISRFAILALVLFTALAQSRPWIALFGSVDCDDCAKVKQTWSEDFTESTDPILVFLPIEHVPNYRLLGELETKLGAGEKADSFPIILLGTKFFDDIDEFWDHEDDFNSLAQDAPDIPETRQIQDAADKADKPLVTLKVTTSAASTANNNDKTSDKAAHLAFFHQKNCAKCSRQEKELELLQQNMPALIIDRFDSADENTSALLARFYSFFNVERSDKNLIPLVCWSNGYITGRLAEATELQSAIEANDGDYFWTAPVTPEELKAEAIRQKSTLDKFLIPSVILSGLADGINPCAFATSLFLISYLLMKKRRKSEIAFVGISFCAGVFLAYFLYGLGLSFLIDFLNQFKWIQKALYSLFAAISIVLAILHVRDAIRFKKTGKTEDMDMGLSKETHKGIHEKIRTLLEHRSWLMIPAAIILGMVVSSMELACTGQIYLPIIVAINSRGITLRAIQLLLVYNIFFMVPLLFVTAVAAMGVGIKKISDWARNNVFSTKITMAVVFAVIAAIMLAVVLPF